MKTIKYFSLLSGIVFAFLFLSSIYAQQPSKIELVNADLLEYDEISSGKLRRLIGNIIFKQDNVHLYCDSAHFYLEKNNVDAFGNVRIHQGDSIRLFGDVLKYYGDLKKAEVHNNIRLSDNKMTLITEQLNYNLNGGIAEFTKGGKINNRENVLNSDKGYYFTERKEFLFKGRVTLINPDYVMNSDTLKYNTANETAYFYGPTKIISKENSIYCENGWYDTKNDISQFNQNASITTKEYNLKGDSLYYNRKNGQGKAFKNIWMVDTIQHFTITGDYAEYRQERENVYVTGNAVLTQIFDDDSLFLHADTLRSVNETNNDTHRTLMAYYGVKIFKRDLQAKCDSLTYTNHDSTMRLFKEPVLWSLENQLTAEYISIVIKHNNLETLHLSNAAFIASQEDSIHFNQIKGKNMVGYFNNNQLYKIRVEGNGQTIYYGKNDEEQKLLGVNKADCSNMLIFIKDNKVETISLLSSPEATFYPINELNPKELQLKGFSWQINKKPKRKEEIFD